MNGVFPKLQHAAEAAEEELLAKQSAAMLAHAEAQAEKAAKSQRGTIAHTPGTAEAKSSSSAAGAGKRSWPFL